MNEKEFLIGALSAQLENLKVLNELNRVLPIDERAIDVKKELAKKTADDLGKYIKDMEIIKRGIEVNLFDDAQRILFEKLEEALE
jgi:hypothetical protein